MMSSNEQKRLEELNKAIGSRKIPYLSSSSDLLPYDLVLLLTHHPLIRQLVRDIAASNTQSASEDEHVQGPAQDVVPERAEAIAVAEKPGQALGQLQAELDSVRGQLAQLQRDKQALQASLQAEQQRRQDLTRQLASQASSPLSTAQTFLKAARADPQLSSLWLGVEPENEQERVIKFIAIAANWDRVEALWDILAERCKSRQTPVPEAFISLLQGCLLIHNTIWQDRAASLLEPETGAPFKSDQHDRCGSLKGEAIAQVWLPGLRNAAGHARRKSLVQTC